MKIFLASILNFALFQSCINNKILGKFFFIGPLWGEQRLFRVVLRLRGMQKNFQDMPKNFYFFDLSQNFFSFQHEKVYCTFF
jgi:hypothetical protein